MSDFIVVRRQSDLNSLLTQFEGTFRLNTLNRYLEESSGDSIKEIRQYGWNTAVCAEFYGPLQRLEVALRETCHIALQKRFGENWYDQNELGLDLKATDMIHQSKLRLSKKRIESTPSNIVSN